MRVKWNGRFNAYRTPDTLFPALRRNRVNVLVSAGSYRHDLAVMRAVTADPRLNIPVLACVAAGVARFHDDLGESAEGIVGPSHWEADSKITPSLGPAPREFAMRMLATLESRNPTTPPHRRMRPRCLRARRWKRRIARAKSDSRGILGFARNHDAWRLRDRSANRPAGRAWSATGAMARRAQGYHRAGSWRRHRLARNSGGVAVIAAGIEMLKLNRGPGDDEDPEKLGDDVGESMSAKTTDAMAAAWRSDSCPGPRTTA